MSDVTVPSVMLCRHVNKLGNTLTFRRDPRRPRLLAKKIMQSVCLLKNETDQMQSKQEEPIGRTGIEIHKFPDDMLGVPEEFHKLELLRGNSDNEALVTE